MKYRSWTLDDSWMNWIDCDRFAIVGWIANDLRVFLWHKNFGHVQNFRKLSQRACDQFVTPVKAL